MLLLSVQRVLPLVQVSGPLSTIVQIACRGPHPNQFSLCVRRMVHCSPRPTSSVTTRKFRSATIASSPYGLCAFAAPPLEVDVDVAQLWRPSFTAVSNIKARVDGSKALGPDGISATVLREGTSLCGTSMTPFLPPSLSACVQVRGEEVDWSTFTKKR